MTLPPADPSGSETSSEPVPRVFRRLGQWIHRLPASKQYGETRGLLILLGVICQWATVWITWPLWQVRSDVPHLPVIDLPPINYGWWMIISAAVILFRPGWGHVFHWSVLIVASLADQLRLQPQFFLIALMISACVSPHAKLITRWLIASTWVWAGLHKLLSSDWLGHSSHWLVDRIGIDADRWYLPLAVAIGLAELLSGVLACIRPRWAAVVAVPMHLGIVLFLIWIDWNESVIPWNFLMATTGGWVMWTCSDDKIVGRVADWAIAAAFMLYPIGFYWGWVDHGFAGVLYSDWLPRGQITTKNGHEFIRAWGDLHVPFPNERRLLRLYFEQSAEPGDKLHISDPRTALPDQHFVLDTEGKAQPISRDEFLVPQERIPGNQSVKGTTVAGIGIDEKRAIFALSQAGVRMVRPDAQHAIFAVEFTPENYDPQLLQTLRRLPNLMQVQLAGTAVTDEEVRSLAELRLLTGLGLAETKVTDEGVRQLRDLPYLQHIEHEGTAITDAGLQEVLKTTWP